MLRKVLLTSALILLGVADAIYGQTGKLFDADKQLSSSFTSQVYLDRDGFIWVATRNGLNRYDGYQFYTIKKENENQRAMASNYVNCMIQDGTGLFYLGMYGALQTYDGSSFHDVEVRDLDGNVVPCYMTCFLQRKNGDLLAGTSGHGLLKIVDRGHAVQQNGPLRQVHTVQDMAEDRQGHIWIVTKSLGLLEYDGKTAKRYFTDPSIVETLRRIRLDKEGNIYVGTSKSGVYVRSAKGGEFRHLDVTGNNHVASLYCCRDGKMMIGFDGKGVAIYDPATGKVSDNPFFSREVDLTKSKVYSMVEDSSGNIWLGLLQKGIFMQPRRVSGFRYLGYKLGPNNVIGQACVISTLIDSKGRCWVGTDKDGLYCMDEYQQLIRHFKEGFPASVMSIAEDSEGRIWVGSWNEGFGYIDAAGNGYHQYPQYKSSSVFAIQSFGQTLWIATMGQGLLRINQTTGQLKAYIMDAKAVTDRKVNSIANDFISKMSLSPDGKRVYLATTMGVCCLDVERESWTSVFGENCLNYGVPARIVKECGNMVWIGTNDGLYCYDKSKKSLHFYTMEKGLADNGIASIEQDKQGRLWIGTDHGLCCHDPKTGLMQSYFVDSGLQSNEFSDGASCCHPRGVMLFGGVGGITWFRPENIQQSKWNAKVSLVNFIVNREHVTSASKSGGYQICDTTVIAASRFDLSPHDNTFAIQFSTLTYDAPEHITYLYSINGDPFIRMQPGTNEITFTHLSPGTYHFKVKAQRDNQFTAEKEFTVVVHTPWYRSLWAWCVYLLAIAFAVWRYRVGLRRKEQNRLRLQEHIHAEEMGEAKLRFFMNISHEIRTPMTLIVTPLTSLIKNETDPNRKNIYETIRRNAERILNLINQMMDLRKIDKGQMPMHMAETDLVAFVKEIHDLFEHQAKSKQIEMVYEHDADTLPVWIDRRNFDKVIVNILSNAFKFTPTGGRINIRVTHDDQHASIVVSDNGEKIPEDKIGRIFERFYQTPSAVNDRNVGTGIGLDLTRSLVELHHGTIEVHNLEQGCEFTVTIPMGNSHLTEEEMLVDKEAEVDALQNDDMSMLEEEGEDVPVVIQQPAGKKPIIVVAEDDDEIRNYLDTELSKDYEVKTCVNGREAFTETLRLLPALVLSDVMMPEMDGNKLCAKIKSNPSTNHIPVILLTAKSRDEDKLEGLETGADAYVVKPFNMDILRRKIVNILNSYRLLQLKFGRNDALEEQVDKVQVVSPDERLLKRVMTVINQHLDDSDLSVDMIADQVGISRVHLHRKMKELTGQTPHDFIRNLRLKQAANLLANRGMSVTEVMYACGFSSSASFSTVFKKFYGMSPRDYMKEHQER